MPPSMGPSVCASLLDDIGISYRTSNRPAARVCDHTVSPWTMDHGVDWVCGQMLGEAEDAEHQAQALHSPQQWRFPRYGVVALSP
jgi:hypothetical protein